MKVTAVLKHTDTNSLSLEPLDGGRRVSHRLAGQDDVLHPGGGDGAVEGQNPGWSCGATNAATKMLYVYTTTENMVLATQ